MKNECRIRNEPRQEAWCMKHNCYYNNSDYLQKARKYGHFTGYKN